MPKAIVIDDDEPPRRRGRSKPAEVVDVDVERNLVMRVLLHSPKDTLAGGVALAAVIAIVGNAMFMQAGRHPAPMFNMPFPAVAPASMPKPTPLSALPASPPSASASSSSSPSPMVAPSQPPSSLASPLPRPRPVEAEARPMELKAAAEPATRAVPAHGASGVMRPPASIPASTRNDPVGDLIVSTRRIASVQRALTDFGYGQLKPTGVAGTDTQAAIQKFERERKLPVTGQISDRVVRELGVVTGRAID
ncbi:peptidoglycan-binding domain-containing protein [Bradyrhizobium prioriisuperbiae]|uniref:peptidoglycan-binding domain-containing protein n=1 Tax=Bradyrhizobium prioriisuperbiae TaxID=2854389 RepID=UPI0028EE3E2D|nr:peptidoglycan-binding domain-containing protein [Bradyrhizobium prioritasuperba]